MLLLIVNLIIEEKFLKLRSRFQEQQENKLRIETITKMFSAIAMTVAAVVVVTIVVPQSPSASLENVVVYEDRVSYRVHVVDPDQAIQNDSLVVRLSNQLEEYETALPFGYTIGAFSELTPNTSYFLEVLANKGFGEERLASQKIKTNPRDGGLILATRLVTSEMYYEQSLEVDVAYYDSNSTYQKFALIYDIVYEYENEESSSSSSQSYTEYYQIPITNDLQTLTISGLYGEFSRIDLGLVGYPSIEEFVIIDRATFTPPFMVNSSIYWDQVGVNKVSASVYPDSRLLGNATYEATLYRGTIKVASKPIEMPETFDYEQEHEIVVTFAGLKELTLYRLEVIVSFLDPVTLRQETKLLETLEATTLGAYEYSLTINDSGSEYIVTVTLIDPSHNFQELYFEVYEQGTYYPVNSGYTGFLSPTDKTGTLYITKPIVSDYYIVIGVRNQTEFFKYDVIHTIQP